MSLNHISKRIRLISYQRTCPYLNPWSLGLGRLIKRIGPWHLANNVADTVKTQSAGASGQTPQKLTKSFPDNVDFLKIIFMTLKRQFLVKSVPHC
jgi:hypothetical protein